MGDTAGGQRSRRTAAARRLELYSHQVGGRRSILQLDGATVCKPLVQRELTFYQTVPPTLGKFVPAYKGILSVEYKINREEIHFVARLPEEEYTQETVEEKKGYQSKDNATYPYIIPKDNINNNCSLKSADEGKRHGCEASYLRNSTKENQATWSLVCTQNEWKGNNEKSSSFSQTVQCIMLENLTQHFQYPSVLDLKMGTKSLTKPLDYNLTWQVSTSPVLGVRLHGMQVYQIPTRNYLRHNKYYGRLLTVDSFHEHLCHFLYNGIRVRHELILPIIAKLQDLCITVQQLDGYRFYSSSLIIIYDGALDGVPPVKTDRSNSSLENLGGEAVEVKLIDFAKTIVDAEKAISQGADSGLLTGIVSLINSLKSILLVHT